MRFACLPPSALQAASGTRDGVDSATAPRADSFLDAQYRQARVVLDAAARESFEPQAGGVPVRL